MRALGSIVVKVNINTDGTNNRVHDNDSCSEYDIIKSILVVEVSKLKIKPIVFFLMLFMVLDLTACFQSNEDAALDKLPKFDTVIITQGDKNYETLKLISYDIIGTNIYIRGYFTYDGSATGDKNTYMCEREYLVSMDRVILYNSKNRVVVTPTPSVAPTTVK